MDAQQQQLMDIINRHYGIPKNREQKDSEELSLELTPSVQACIDQYKKAKTYIDARIGIPKGYFGNNPSANSNSAPK